MRLVDEIICKMAGVLDEKQLNYLKFVMMETFKEHETNEIVPRDNMNEKFLKLFAIELKIQQKSDGTIRQYINSAMKFLEETGKDVRDVESEDTVLYFAKMVRDAEIAPRTMDNHRRWLRTFFTWLNESGYINKNPMLRIKPIKYAERPKDFFTDDEIEMIRDACDDVKDRALVDFLLCTGVRVSEVVNLTWDRIQIDRGIAEIYAEKTKTWRKVFLDARARKHLRDLKKITDINKHPLVFFKAKQTIEKHLHAIGERAEINKQCTVHVFRRTFVSRMYRRGMSITDIAKLCGHATTATTVKYYLQVNDEDTHYKFNQVA